MNRQQKMSSAVGGMKNWNTVGLLAGVLVAALGAAASGAVVTFDNGLEGWEGPQGPGGASFIDGADGNPAASYRTQFNNFGIDFINNTNPGFIGDFTATPALEFSVDIKARQVEFFFQPVTRSVMVEFRNTALAVGTPYPWVSVWYELGVISSGLDWTTWGVTVTDTSSLVLPAGWGGYGDEDPNTFEPRLPAGVTFRDVMAGVDTIAISTLIPGFFFGFTDFDVSVDNITLNRVPTPGAAGVMVLGAAMVGGRRRRGGR